jgi:putative tryptophan/tyrosine transport system substrate-binding protein
VGNDADLIMAADVRPLTSRLTRPNPLPTLTPEPLLLVASLGILGDTAMTRRAMRLLVTLALGLLMVPLAADAQPAGKGYRIGYLGNSALSLEIEIVQAFRQGLRELGYVEGENLAIEYRWAEGSFERLPALVAELVSLPVDVIVTVGTPGTRAAKHATRTIPIVMAVSADAVRDGLVASLARPGGNVTGSSTMTHEIEGKRLQLLKEVAPAISRVAFVWNPANPANVRSVNEQQIQLAAQVLGVMLLPVEIRRADAFEEAFATITKARPDALFVMADRFLLAHRAGIVDFAATHRLPAMCPYKEYVEAGCLMSYSPSFPDLFRRAATFVDKILKGTNPADLPVEQPNTFELVINLKNAQALGLTIPPTILFQATEVIR